MDKKYWVALAISSISAFILTLSFRYTIVVSPAYVSDDGGIRGTFTIKRVLSLGKNPPRVFFPDGGITSPRYGGACLIVGLDELFGPQPKCTKKEDCRADAGWAKYCAKEKGEETGTCWGKPEMAEGSYLAAKYCNRTIDYTPWRTWPAGKAQPVSRATLRVSDTNWLPDRLPKRSRWRLSGCLWGRDVETMALTPCILTPYGTPTTVVMPPSLIGSVERDSMGAWVHLSGRGFTEGGTVRFYVEGLNNINGRYGTGTFVSAKPDGSFSAWWHGQTWAPGGDARIVAVDTPTHEEASMSIPALH